MENKISPDGISILTKCKKAFTYPYRSAFIEEKNVYNT